MDLGVYESLLTERLYAQLHSRSDLQPHYGAVDDAEQALTIARYLAPIIEPGVRRLTPPAEREVSKRDEYEENPFSG